MPKPLRPAVLSLLLCGPAAALTLHPTLGSHAVLQRDRAVPVFGSDVPGSRVRVTLLDGGRELASAEAITRDDGRFAVELPPQPAGGPYAIDVVRLPAAGLSEVAQRIDDVLFGEVWVASGQSNMQWPVSRSDGGGAADAEPIAGVRHLQVERTAAPKPADAPSSAAWRRTEPGHTAGFSAVAHHFARELHAEAGVPVGILHASWGGTPAAAWTPRPALRSTPETAPLIEADDAAAATPHDAAARAEALAAWEARHAPGGPESPRWLDPGLEPGEIRYAATAYDDGDWAPVDLPVSIESLPGADPAGVDGAAWFRKRVALPAALRGRALTLRLGRIDDADTAFVDGVEVGRTPQTLPRPYAVERAYAVPAAATGDGELVIAVRVFDDYGEGGFTGRREDLRLGAEGVAPLAIADGWRARITGPRKPLGRPVVAPPGEPGPPAQNRPAFLYNGMIAGLTRTPVAGIIWYQGESDAGEPERYRTLFPLLIRSWREAWGRPALPFLFVQLARFRAPLGEAFRDDGWGPIRDAQAHANATVPATGMAVILDLDDPDFNDIHPGNKTDVGRRLARLALRDVYGRDVAAEGPRVAGVVRRGRAAVVRFDAAAPPLRTDDGAAPAEFWLRAADGTIARAAAAIEPAGDALRLTAPGVDEPVEVIYAWATNPIGVNLTDGTGLPTAPFRLPIAD
ncbi:sialate O-acetylesterase [Phycisphaera mikurensis]|uniref:Sialate O-acetylesterase domain-containing protein n=1 Tax=Phycisphaera mikurensis (strain NBRC 102666 / KCTC 22515 / FYK2301M01) TaxID=1142394 RepID=I0IGP0_PHYMF|nr:sialate O-acetylesterase [Phycisphaera mikurensis]MBB6443217.1 sialate O-acetylesterase [Phycisphaera mikurensis]BAM04428.1 hypothetical protein PSMK_22690 [Phycisphaera mikurensis NBRC 102666]